MTGRSAPSPTAGRPRPTPPRPPHARAALLAAAAALLLGACAEGDRAADGDVRRDDAVAVADWPTIVARDTLRIGAPYNSTTYFIYRGEPLGYEYELLRRFAAGHDLAVQVVVAQSRDSLLALLRDGRVDVVAGRLVARPDDGAQVAFTRAIYRADPVLVQRDGSRRSAAADLPGRTDTVLRTGPAAPARRAVPIRARLIEEPAELAGRTVTVPERSPYERTLVELADSITGEIRVVEVDASSETLMREVARGNIGFTVTEGNLAELQSAYFSNLVVQPVLGATREVVWALHPRAAQLRARLDGWIAADSTDALFDALYRKYFVDRLGYRERVASRYLSSETGTLSPYDSLFKAHAPRLGWDWRLLGSQAYQESQFKPTARSWAGARGLMQLMPATARQYGARDVTNPAQNVAAGVGFLAWLQDYWRTRIPDPDERIRFVLASYNAGHGHLEDAHRLTQKRGGDPNRWEDVAYWLLQLSRAEFYEDPVVRYGFVRGLEPVTYVSLVMARFDHYRQFVTPELAGG